MENTPVKCIESTIEKYSKINELNEQIDQKQDEINRRNLSKQQYNQCQQEKQVFPFLSFNKQHRRC